MEKRTLWKFWAERESSIGCCLTASHPAILLGAVKWTATANRGEAVCAALKLANVEDVVGPVSGYIPGDLPINLFNKVLLAQGLMTFDIVHEVDENESVDTCSSFFQDIFPTTAD